MSSTDWNTFNGKQNALTNPVTGTGTSNYVSKFTGTSTLGNGLIYDNGSGVTVNSTTVTRVFNVYSATADNHVLIAGSAPSVSLADALSGATYQAKFGLATGANQFVTNAAAGDFAISSQGTSSILWGVNGTEAMRIFGSTKNIAIGSSGTDAGYKLDVTGTGRFTGQLIANSTSFPLDIYGTTNNYGLRINNVQAATLFLYSSNANAASRNWGLYTNSAVYGDFDIRQSNAINGDMTVGSNSTSRFYIKNDGNVGIGNTSPAFKLSVLGTSDNQLVLDGASGGLTSQYFKVNGTYSGQLVANGTNFYLTSLGTSSNLILGGGNAVNALYLWNSGNITTSGTDNGNKLQVSGTIFSNNSINYDTYGSVRAAVSSVYNGTKTVTISGGSVNGVMQIMVGVYGNGQGSSARAMWIAGGYINNSMGATEVLRVNGGSITISAITSNSTSLTFTVSYSFPNAADFTVNVITGNANTTPPTITIN